MAATKNKCFTKKKKQKNITSQPIQQTDKNLLNFIKTQLVIKVSLEK